MRTFAVDGDQNVLAFFDGRLEGVRLHSSKANWLDDGAFALGTAVYAIVNDKHAVVVDSGMTLCHGRAIRSALVARGVERITVVLTHHHADHIGGNAAFADCGDDIVARQATKEEIAKNAAKDDPPVEQLTMPNKLVSDTETTTLHVGAADDDAFALELRPVDIHTRDGLVVCWPKRGLCFAGDTLEDNCTYVDEPTRLREHVADLQRMRQWSNECSHVLPAHGHPDIIEAGGYTLTDFVDETIHYVEYLQTLAADTTLPVVTMRQACPSARYLPAYEQVHNDNVKAVRNAAAQSS